MSTVYGMSRLGNSGRCRVTLADVKAAQPNWFSRSNKRMFGDVSYRILHGKASGNPYLVRSTYAWSDMFGQPKRLSWRINALNPETLDIRPLVENGREFADLDAVRDWLRTA